MKSKLSRIARLVIFALTLAMFAIAAGAPEFIGTVGH
jgi:hypothetical protein